LNRQKRSMIQYQLILQFSSESLADYDTMVALENELTAAVGDTGDIDGHDFGSGEANIFILTSDPARIFQQARPVLEQWQVLQFVKVAYRQVDGERYTVIWPEGSTAEFRVR
jgi:hypothetical protein